MAGFRHTVRVIGSSWNALPAGTRILAGFLVVILGIVVTWGLTAAGRETMTKILDGSTPADVRAQALAKLAELGIPRKVDGDSIYVAPGQTDAALLQLHSAGVLGDEAIFKHIWETNIFGTRAEMDKRWLVTIQQRLGRMIARMEPVRAASVQITPESETRSLGFKGSEAGAAIFLELRPGAALTSSNVNGICNLVAASWQGLKPHAVKIMDQSMKWYRIPQAQPGAGGSDLRDQELEYARQLEEKALKVLPAGSQVSAMVRLCPEGRETSTATEKIQAPLGAKIESVAVAVVIPFLETATPPETAGYSALVRTAVGANDVMVQLMPVAKPQPPPPPAPVVEPPWWWKYAGQGALVLLAFVALFVVWRLLQGMTLQVESVTSEESHRAPGDGVLSPVVAESEVELARMKDSARDVVDKNPGGAADLVRKWVGSP